MGNIKVRIIAAAVMLAFAASASAQTAEPAAPNPGQTLVATKIASNFSNLAGGEENALALVRSLRTGTDVNLVTTVPPPEGSPPGTLPTTTTTTFTPPTKPMGWGNVKHSLALAQDQLARAGITNPTAEQLQTALMGGDLVRTNADGTTTTTTVKGILTMRADGMGWGNIAKEGGTKLGHVQKVDMSAKGVKSTAPSAAAPASGVTTAAAGASTTSPKSAKGITTATGGSVAAATGQGPSKGITTASSATAPHGSKGLVTASGASANAGPQGNAYGRGIVTGAGGGSTNVAAAAHGNKHTSAGVVTATGSGASSVSTASGNNAGGHGKGNGGGNGKGKGG